MGSINKYPHVYHYNLPQSKIKWADSVINGTDQTAAVVQWVRAFASQEEGWCSNHDRDRPKS